MDREHLEAYWAKNLSLIRNLLVVWAVVAYVLGILLAPALNGIRLFGGPPPGLLDRPAGEHLRLRHPHLLLRQPHGGPGPEVRL